MHHRAVIWFFYLTSSFCYDMLFAELSCYFDFRKLAFYARFYPGQRCFSGYTAPAMKLFAILAILSLVLNISASFLFSHNKRI